LQCVFFFRSACLSSFLPVQLLTQPDCGAQTWILEHCRRQYQKSCRSQGGCRPLLSPFSQIQPCHCRRRSGWSDRIYPGKSMLTVPIHLPLLSVLRNVDCSHSPSTPLCSQKCPRGQKFVLREKCRAGKLRKSHLPLYAFPFSSTLLFRSFLNLSVMPLVTFYNIDKQVTSPTSYDSECRILISHSVKT